MYNPLISVIVPVYNVNKYLEYCIHSIINQTYKNLEIILVDDGSTDGSQHICEGFSRKDNRIKIIHKTNGGPISSRKAGLKISEGEYIGFVDSDDWISPNMYELMVGLSIKNNADIVASGFIIEEEKDYNYINSIRSGNYIFQELEKNVYPNMIIFKDCNYSGIIPSISNKLFKKNVIYKNIMQLDERITNGEDAAAFYLACLDSNCIYITNKCWYHYRIRENSISRKLEKNYFENIIILYNYLSKKFRSSKYSNVLMPQLIKYIALQIDYGSERLFHIKRPKMWLFPYNLIKNGSRVILYGAGDVGQAYYKQIQVMNYCSIDLWVDKNYTVYENSGLSVNSPNIINSIEYDYVVIAISNENIRNEIEHALIKKGIQQKKIINIKPKLFS